MNARFVLLGLACLLLIPTRGAAQPDSVELRARVTGYLAKVNVKAGDLVKKGDVLFELDARPQRAELDKVEAELRAAEARLERHRTEMERAQRLAQAKVISREEIDRITADRAQSEANVRATQASRELAKLQLDFARVLAPIDGVIGRRLIMVGNLVKADDTLLAVLTPADAQAKPSDKLKELLKQRRDLLTKAAELVLQRYKEGNVPVKAVLQAQRAALDASLELCETSPERVELLRNDLKSVGEMLKTAEAGFKAGAIPETELLQSQVLVLEVRIKLLREQESEKPGK